MSGVCRRCGCTDARACIGGCWWATPARDLCSRCADQAERDARPGWLRRLVDRLPERVKDWLGGLVVEYFWRPVASVRHRRLEVWIRTEVGGHALGCRMRPVRPPDHAERELVLVCDCYAAIWRRAHG